MSTELLSLAKRLIAYETCEQQNIVECAGFVEAWLEARDIEATRETVRGLPVVKAGVGPKGAPTGVLEGHIDLVPGHAGRVGARLAAAAGCWAPGSSAPRRSPASRPTCTSGSRRRACWHCVSR